MQRALVLRYVLCTVPCTATEVQPKIAIQFGWAYVRASTRTLLALD